MISFGGYFDAKKPNNSHQNSRVHTLVTISLGVDCGLPNQLHDKEAILAVADNALYRAKKMGRNRVIEAEIR